MFAAQTMSEGLESLSRHQLEPVGCPAGVEAFRPGNPLSAYISWDPVDLLPSVSRCNRPVGGPVPVLVSFRKRSRRRRYTTPSR